MNTRWIVCLGMGLLHYGATLAVLIVVINAALARAGSGRPLSFREQVFEQSGYVIAFPAWLLFEWMPSDALEPYALLLLANSLLWAACLWLVVELIALFKERHSIRNRQHDR